MVKYHEPVMLYESIQQLNIKPAGIYVDVTYGGGGHTKEILTKIGNGKVIAFDQDLDAIENKIDDERLILVNQNFRNMIAQLKYQNLLPVDGILADLGVSSYQFDKPERGFSTRFDAALDMRMNTAQSLKASDILNTYSVEKLQEMFSVNAEVHNAKTLAEKIVESRINGSIESINQFKDLIRTCVNTKNENQYYAKVFQALRIEVNDEFGALKEFLQQSAEALAPGGRLVVISYHSLEDRLVKRYMKNGLFKGEPEKDMYGHSPAAPFKVITKKPITSTDQELIENPRSRSAKLRVAEKV